MAGGKGSIWGIREAPSVTASGEREAAWTLSNLQGGVAPEMGVRRTRAQKGN